MNIYANMFAPISICMTGKLETTLPEYKVAFLNAVDLALRQSVVKQKVLIKTFFYDSKPLSPIRAYNQMLRNHCAAIIGFEYLSDLLLITKLQKDEDIPIFTSYASSNSWEKLPKNIFLFMPSYDYHAKKMLEFLRTKFGLLNKVLIITEVDRIDLAKYKIAYEKQLKQEKIFYDQFDFIGNDEQSEKKLINFLTNKTYSYVFIFSSAVASTKIIHLMNNHKIIFIGTENFGSSSNPSVFVRLNDKKISAYTIRNLDFLKSNTRLADYRREYIKQYKNIPNPLSVYTYDAMKILLKTIEKNQLINTAAVLKTNFNGITGAAIKDGEFCRSNQYVILSLSEKGFVYEH
ncbi:MAG: amino acid ABC transporter substrate-binding protein [Proteobacteria bacterium]|nr:amino acid ABC transporter substrate-binding protein [Pseudomonadota bacterium]